MHDGLKTKIDADVAEFGRAVLAIIADEKSGTPPFSYTIGNAKRGLPELLVVGLLDNWALNQLSDAMIRRGRKFDDHEIVSLGGERSVCVVDAGHVARRDFTIQAGRWLGTEDYPVMQVVVPDKAGLFPWQAACADPYRRVPVLAERPIN